MGKNDFFREKVNFLFWGMGGRFGEEVGKLRGGARGEAPLHFLVDSFGADGKSGIFGAVAQVEKSA